MVSWTSKRYRSLSWYRALIALSSTATAYVKCLFETYLIFCGEQAYFRNLIFFASFFACMIASLPFLDFESKFILVCSIVKSLLKCCNFFYLHAFLNSLQNCIERNPWTFECSMLLILRMFLSIFEEFNLISLRNLLYN